MLNTDKTQSLFRRATLALGMAAVLAPAAMLSSPVVADPLLSGDTMKVGMEISYPPFESYEGDKVVGFDPEMSALLAAKLGAEASFVDTKFTSLILGLGANKFDAVISGMYVTDERQKQAEAIPYARTGAYIMVNKGSDIQPKTKEDLCGVEVGLQQGTAWVKQLTELSASYCVPNGKDAITIREFPSAPEVSQALLSRNVDAQLEIAGAAMMFAERTRGRIEISSPDLVYPQTLGIYVKKGNAELKQALQTALAEITADGDYPELLKKYNLLAAE